MVVTNDVIPTDVVAVEDDDAPANEELTAVSDLSTEEVAAKLSTYEVAVY